MLNHRAIMCDLSSVNTAAQDSCWAWDKGGEGVPSHKLLAHIFRVVECTLDVNVLSGKCNLVISKACCPLLLFLLLC